MDGVEWGWLHVYVTVADDVISPPPSHPTHVLHVRSVIHGPSYAAFRRKRRHLTVRETGLALTSVVICFVFRTLGALFQRRVRRMAGCESADGVCGFSFSGLMIGW